MRFKLDENLGRSVVEMFRSAGHDTSSVHLQRLEGTADGDLLRVCTAERRTLVTLDLDFANPIHHDPRLTAGIAVLRLPRDHRPTDVHAAVGRLLDALATRSIEASLWVIRPDRVRVWQQPVDQPQDGPGGVEARPV